MLKIFLINIIDLKFKILLFLEIEIYIKCGCEIGVQVVFYNLSLSNDGIFLADWVLQKYFDLGITHGIKIKVD
jgi:hypothetical protein